MHKDMKELRALKEEAAQAARQAIFDEREREVREARRRQWLEAQNSPNTQYRIPNTCHLQNEPNQIQNRPEMDLEGLDPELLKAIQELTDPTA
jgi:hypothetical protein